MIKAYVAGPYRAKTEHAVTENIRRAEDVGQRLLRLGIMPLVPHLCWKRWGGIVDDKIFLAMGIELLQMCDAIVVLPGFEYSKGTLGEMAYAETHGIKLFFWPDDLTHIQELANG